MLQHSSSAEQSSHNGFVVFGVQTHPRNSVMGYCPREESSLLTFSLFATPIWFCLGSGGLSTPNLCKRLLEDFVPLDQPHIGRGIIWVSTESKPALCIQLCSCNGARGSLYGCTLSRYRLDHLRRALSAGDKSQQPFQHEEVNGSLCVSVPLSDCALKYISTIWTQPPGRSTRWMSRR